jgi:apolipoprotein D and lipocalin family protein
MRAVSWLLLVGSLSFSPFVLGCQHESLDVVHVDLQQMKGKWYEIAKLPRLTQARCTGTTAEYQVRSASELLVINECHEGSLGGPLKRIAARAVASDPSEPAKLSLDFGFAYGDYWVIDVGAQYEYLVVGHPSRDYLWILSRTPTLDSDTLSSVVERAKQKGFKVAFLDYTEQQ